MTIAAVILCVFAAIWAMFGLSFAGVQMPWLALPPLISGVLLVWVLPQVRAAGWARAPGTRRTVAIWSGVEIAAVVLAVMLLKRTGHIDALAPVMALIVGAHMLPIARGIGARFQYFTGFGLIAAGLGAFMLGGATRTIFAGLGCAAILWASAAYLGYRAQSGARP